MQIGVDLHGMTRQGMIRSLIFRSVPFRIAAWFFIATLFCDGANLDDLFRGIVVLHDDDELATVDLVLGCGSTLAFFGARFESSGGSRIEQPGPLFRFSVRVAIDQDSPSLAASELRTICEPLLKPQDSPARTFDNQLPTQLLHLRFHSLLI
jgi:hypothetical protein